MPEQAANSRRVLIRDLLVFQLKLVIDGFKDVFVAQVALVAAIAGLLFGGAQRGRWFYRVMEMSEKFDLWLNLNGASRSARSHPDGLFGVSRAGDDTLLGRLEEMVRGPETPAEHAAHSTTGGW